MCSTNELTSSAGGRRSYQNGRIRLNPVSLLGRFVPSPYRPHSGRCAVTDPDEYVHKGTLGGTVYIDLP
jgi:hypothetical protein